MEDLHDAFCQNSRSGRPGENDDTIGNITQACAPELQTKFAVGTMDISDGVGADNRDCGDDSRSSGELEVVGMLLDKEEKFLTACCDFKTVLRIRPSKFKSYSKVGWISLPIVVNAESEEEEEEEEEEEDNDVDGLLKEWKWHLENDTPVNFPLVRDLAIKYQVLCGKWMIFCKHGPHIDLTWNLIARCHLEGKLGISTKVSTTPEDKTRHVICVYNNNFTDKKDVFELEGKLRSVGIRCTMRYKPDVFTYCVIYRLNKWEMKSFIYTSRFDVKTKKSIIVKEYNFCYDGDDSAKSGGDDGTSGSGDDSRGAGGGNVDFHAVCD